MDEISRLIAEKGLKPADCAYHTIRMLENGGKVRALVIKGDSALHIEYTCPKCKHSGYKKEEWKHVSKAAKVRFSVKCDKCGLAIKVEKLKGGAKKKGGA